MAGWSKDPSTRVGAVIADGKHVVSVGFNGFPPSMADRPEWLNERPTKYLFVIHAEVNALLNARQSVKGCTLYVSLHPCPECAKTIAAAGITRVVTKIDPECSSTYRSTFDQARRVFDANGIQLEVY